MRPVPVACVIRLVLNFTSRDSEGDGFVGFGSNLKCSGQSKLELWLKWRATHNEILVRFVWGFPLLLPSAHKPSPRNDAGLDLWKVNLHHHTLLSSIRVSDLGDTVTRSANFEEDFTLDIALRGGDHKLRFLCIASGATGKVGLMLLSLRVREVGAFVRVQCQAETTF